MKLTVSIGLLQMMLSFLFGVEFLFSKWRWSWVLLSLPQPSIFHSYGNLSQMNNEKQKFPLSFCNFCLLYFRQPFKLFKVIISPSLEPNEKFLKLPIRFLTLMSGKQVSKNWDSEHKLDGLDSKSSVANKYCSLAVIKSYYSSTKSFTKAIKSTFENFICL